MLLTLKTSQGDIHPTSFEPPMYSVRSTARQEGVPPSPLKGILKKPTDTFIVHEPKKPRKSCPLFKSLKKFKCAHKR